MKILFTLIVSLCLCGPAYAQSSQTLTTDLEIAKQDVRKCLDSYQYLRSEGKIAPQSKKRVMDKCIDYAVNKYQLGVEIEERLIEGIGKACCPNIRHKLKKEFP